MEDLRALYAAVLNRALMDLTDSGAAEDSHGIPARQRLHKVEALNWFFSEDEGCTSFINVCSFLRLDPNEIRPEVLQIVRGKRDYASYLRDWNDEMES